MPPLYPNAADIAAKLVSTPEPAASHSIPFAPAAAYPSIVVGSVAVGVTAAL